MPDEVASEISKLIVITDDDISALINQHAAMITEGREKYGPKARFGKVPSVERARRTLEFLRRNELDWLFFRRWRIGDGWLSEKRGNPLCKYFSRPARDFGTQVSASKITSYKAAVIRMKSQIDLGRTCDLMSYYPTF